MSNDIKTFPNLSGLLHQNRALHIPFTTQSLIIPLC